MISVEEAKKNIFDHIKKTFVAQKETVSLSESLGRVTAEPIVSRLPCPLFDNSAMDGFALRYQETLSAHPDHPVTLKVTGECQAGDPPSDLTAPLTAIRIMTGAVIPLGANAVVMQEKVVQTKWSIQLKEPVRQGQNIRKEGEDITRGEIALEKGHILSSGSLSFLSSIGVTHLSVTTQPKISIFVTGNELVSEPSQLKPGKILESNSSFLKAALHEMGLSPLRIQLIKDNPDHLQQPVEASLKDSDIVILTGGVSVGEYDLTKKILKKLNVNPLFWKVNQKPGKPLYVGHSNETLIFGLPGNPYAVFCCFQIYIRPCLLQFMNHPKRELTHTQMPLHESWVKKDSKNHFLKGKIVHNKNGPTVKPLKGQGSHLMRSLSHTDVLISINGEPRQLSSGTLVDVIHLF